MNGEAVARYNVFTKCSNCLTEKRLSIVCGVRVDQYPCPDCGCYTLAPYFQKPEKKPANIPLAHR